MNRARNTNPNGGMTNNGMNNGTTNNGMNNGRVMGAQRGERVAGDLAEQIRALCFVKKELELYLDTHPDCRTALDYYHRTVAELDRLTEEYENTVGPLTSKGVVNTDRWTWVQEPWPWQRPGDYMQPREDR